MTGETLDFHFGPTATGGNEDQWIKTVPGRGWSYGTIARWVETLGEWNPSLSEQDCFAAVQCWFGLKLPGVKSLADLDEKGFPDEFFSEVVYSETRRALDAVGDP